MNTFYVYIMATQPNGTLYIGITNNLIRRVFDHKNETLDGFTKKYKVHLLVWFDSTNSVESAIVREKQLKKWNRQWKINLIESSNPDWKDLSDGWY
ncbi:MAG: GIY-YIG nuclease family protein [Bacteroidetes bacterium]|nr:GIY-YIG nuclease family protein [Bacteroidota bacterium]